MMNQNSEKRALLSKIEVLIAMDSVNLNLARVFATVRNPSELESMLNVLEYYQKHKPRIVKYKERYMPKYIGVTDPKKGQRKSLKGHHAYKDKELLVQYIDLMILDYKTLKRLPPNNFLIPPYPGIPVTFYYATINYLEQRAGVRLEDRTCKEILKVA